MFRRPGLRRIHIVILLSVAISGPELSSQDKTANSGNGITAEHIVERLVAANADRAAKLAHFEGSRKYELEYRGFPGARQAEMDVEVSFTNPATKDFRIVTTTGSKVIIDRVFRKLLESEREAATPENQERNALNTTNYEFQLLATEEVGGALAYILAAKPRVKSKYLFHGKVWVDGRDYAVARIEAEPAVNPSIFISRTEIVQEYAKIGEFWLPSSNRSVSHVRLGGQATLTIHYSDYRVVAAATRVNGSTAQMISRSTRCQAITMPNLRCLDLRLIGSRCEYLGFRDSSDHSTIATPMYQFVPLWGRSESSSDTHPQGSHSLIGAVCHGRLCIG